MNGWSIDVNVTLDRHEREGVNTSMHTTDIFSQLQSAVFDAFNVLFVDATENMPSSFVPFFYFSAYLASKTAEHFI